MSGKRYTDQLKSFDRDQFYTPTEALGLVKGMSKAKFDESVDVSVRLGVDPRKADQMVRGTVALPAGTGKDVRVAVFADRSFSFILKTPPAPVLLRQKAGLAKGSTTPGKAVAGTVTEADIEEVAKIKMPDLNAYDLDAAKEQIRGTARSMGLKVNG